MRIRRGPMPTSFQLGAANAALSLPLCPVASSFFLSSADSSFSSAAFSSSSLLSVPLVGANVVAGGTLGPTSAWAVAASDSTSFFSVPFSEGTMRNIFTRAWNTLSSSSSPVLAASPAAVSKTPGGEAAPSSETGFGAGRLIFGTTAVPGFVAPKTLVPNPVVGAALAAAPNPTEPDAAPPKAAPNPEAAAVPDPKTDVEVPPEEVAPKPEVAAVPDPKTDLGLSSPPSLPSPSLSLAVPAPKPNPVDPPPAPLGLFPDAARLTAANGLVFAADANETAAKGLDFFSSPSPDSPLSSSFPPASASADPLVSSFFSSSAPSFAFDSAASSSSFFFSSPPSAAGAAGAAGLGGPRFTLRILLFFSTCVLARSNVPRLRRGSSLASIIPSSSPPRESIRS
mmetsp:Transcript_30877/g.92543  ORF Transcript_30877/g.92543 Transcript_30877/m.92543 type:complete len:397 (-) Transcript_30877:188-1378(-)